MKKVNTSLKLMALAVQARRKALASTSRSERARLTTRASCLLKAAAQATDAEQAVRIISASNKAAAKVEASAKARKLRKISSVKAATRAVPRKPSHLRAEELDIVDLEDDVIVDAGDELGLEELDEMEADLDMLDVDFVGAAEEDNEDEVDVEEDDEEDTEVDSAMLRVLSRNKRAMRARRGK